MDNRLKICEKINDAFLPAKFHSNKPIKWALLEYAIDRVEDTEELVSIKYHYVNENCSLNVEKVELVFTENKCEIRRASEAKDKEQLYCAIWNKRGK